MSAKRERLMFRVDRGALVPADAYTLKCLRERGYALGDVLAADITKPRSPGFWRLAHQLGTLCVENIEAFKGGNAHAALKKIQVDAGIECEETRTEVPGFGVLTSRRPKSLAFESMDQGEFHRVMLAMCRYVSETYWPHLSEKAIADMAGCMVED